LMGLFDVRIGLLRVGGTATTGIIRPARRCLGAVY
jgi:hypothetical protein